MEIKKILFCFLLVIMSSEAHPRDTKHKTNLYKSAENEIQKIKEMSEKLDSHRDTLNSLIKRNLAAGIDTSEERVLLGVLNIFLNYFLPRNLESGSISEVKNNLNYLLSRVLLLFRQMEEDYFLKWVSAIKNFRIFPCVIKNGIFVSGLNGIPIIYSGIADGEKFINDLQALHDCGFNIVCVKISPREVFPKKGREEYIPINRIIKILEMAEKCNVSVVVSLSLSPLPEWICLEDNGERSCSLENLHTCMGSPVFREFTEKFLSAVIPRIKDKLALHSYYLADDITYEEYCDIVQEKFRRYLRKVYKTIDKVNNRWKTEYREFDEINISKVLIEGEKVSTALKYDWFTFQSTLLLDFFRFVRQCIRKYDKKTPLCIAALPNVFEKTTKHFDGVDVERLSQLCEINGSRSFVSYKLSRGFLGEEEKLDRFLLEEYMFYDFLKSIDGNKPIFCSDDRTLEIVPSPQYVSAILWRRALHCRDGQVPFFDLPLTTSMENIELLGRTNIYLRKLARYIGILNNQNVPFAIFFSNTAKILSTKHLQAVKKVYEGLYSLGFPIRFITERQILSNDKLKNCKILFLPAAEFLPSRIIKRMEKFVISGGKLICIGDNMLYDEYGNPHKVEWLKRATLGKGEIIKLSSELTVQKYANLFSALLEDFISVKIVNPGSGKMMWRCVEDDGKKICFFVNLSEWPLSFKIKSKKSEVTGLRYIFRSGEGGIQYYELGNISYPNEDCREIGVVLSEHVVLSPLETAIVEFIEY